jgi:glycosyltransferase involved in cell wall biosynthesis
LFHNLSTAGFDFSPVKILIMTLNASVVIPTYNRAHLVPRAVATVLANTEPGDEILVVDDGSTDGTKEALAPFRDRIRLLSGRHAGHGAARNMGIREARGDLVAFLDSDDEWMPNKLAMQKAVFEARPDVLFCFSDFAGRDAQGLESHRTLVEWTGDRRPYEQVFGPGVWFSSLGVLPEGQSDFQVHVADMYLAMLLNYAATFTAVVRRDAAGSTLAFPEDLHFYEDAYLFSRLSRLGKGAFLDLDTAWQNGHVGPRLTDENLYVKLSCCIKFLEGVYGQDREFLNRHETEYRQRLALQFTQRARYLLVRGRTREARADLIRAGNAPFADRVLARMPGALARGLLGLRRALSGKAK